MESASRRAGPHAAASLRLARAGRHVQRREQLERIRAGACGLGLVDDEFLAGVAGDGEGLEGHGECVEDLLGRPALPPLLDLDVVLDRDAGEERDLGAAQPRNLAGGRPTAPPRSRRRRRASRPRRAAPWAMGGRSHGRAPFLVLVHERGPTRKRIHDRSTNPFPSRPALVVAPLRPTPRREATMLDAGTPAPS
jgi:hypothetical protein